MSWPANVPKGWDLGGGSGVPFFQGYAFCAAFLGSDNSPTTPQETPRVEEGFFLVMMRGWPSPTLLF